MAHFAVSQIRCAKEIDLWVRTLPGNTSSLLGGVKQRVGNVGNAVMAKCMKVDEERMITEVWTRNYDPDDEIHLSYRDRGRKLQDLKMESDMAKGGRLVALAILFWMDKIWRREKLVPIWIGNCSSTS